MKTCICLSGQLRLFKTSFQTFKKNVLDLNDCDLFIDTWKFTNKKEDINSSYRYKDEGTIEELFDMYKPKVLNIESFDDKFENKSVEFETIISQKQGRRSDNYLRRYYSMLYKVYNCNQIRKRYEKYHSITYDVVVRGRLDIIYNQPIKLEKTNDLIVELYGNGKGTGGDVFAYGNSNDIDVYSDLFLYLQEYFNLNVKIDTEILLPHHLAKNIPNYKIIDNKLSIARPRENWLQ